MKDMLTKLHSTCCGSLLNIGNELSVMFGKFFTGVLMILIFDNAKES